MVVMVSQPDHVGFGYLLKQMEELPGASLQMPAGVTALCAVTKGVVVGLESGELVLIERDGTPRSLKKSSSSSLILGLDETGEATVVSLAKDGAVVLWDLDQLIELRLLQASTPGIAKLAAYGPSQIILAHINGPVSVYEQQEWKVFRSYQIHEKHVTALATLKDGRAVSSAVDVKVWRIASGEVLASLSHDLPCINDLIVTSAGKCVGSAYQSSSLKVWDLTTYALETTLQGHTDDILCLAALPNGNCATGSYDCSIRIWDLKNPEPLSCLQLKTRVAYLAVARGGQCCSATSKSDLALPYQPTVWLWDFRTQPQVCVYEGHAGPATCLAVTSDGKCVSGSEDTTLRVWDLLDQLQLAVLRGHTGLVTCVALTSDFRCVSGSSDCSLRVWSLKTYTQLGLLEGHSASITSLVVTEDLRAISGARDHTLRAWDLGSCLQLALLQEHQSPITQLAMASADCVASLSEQGDIVLWDLTRYEVKQGAIGVMIPSYPAEAGDRKDGKTYQVGMIRDWRLAAQGKDASGNSYRHCVADRNGHFLSAQGSAFTLWDYATSSELSTLKGYQSAEVSFFREVTEWVWAVGYASGGVEVWDLQESRLLAARAVHQAPLECVAVTEDAGCVTGSADGTVRVWDLRDFRPSSTFSPPTLLLASLAQVRKGATYPNWRLPDLGLNALHIYAYENHHSVLFASLASDELSLVRGYYGSPMTLALQRKTVRAVDAILQYCVEQEGNTEKLECNVAALTDDLPTLLSFRCSNLEDFFALLMQPHTLYPDTVFRNHVLMQLCTVLLTVIKSYKSASGQR